MNINDVVSLLVKRDGISENEAHNLVINCREDIYEALSSENLYGVYDTICDIVADWLGLEPDYIDVILE